MLYPEECKLKKPLIFDSHAHYDDEQFDGCRDELLSQLNQNGVCGIVTCGCDGDSCKKALAIAEKHDFVYAAVGIHPENIESRTDIAEIERFAAHKKCVAIGEIGLDYYWEPYDREAQKAVFVRQLELAEKLNLPVIVHDRDAHADTLEILKKYRPKGVVHCFSGSPEMATEILKLGMYIGVGGVVTFKNAKRLPETVALVPDDRLLVETDAPYLSPVPYRGETCHSGLIALTAAKIAEIRGKTAEEILSLTAHNAETLFKIGR